MSESARVANENFVDDNINVVVDPKDDKEKEPEVAPEVAPEAKLEVFAEPIKMMQKEMDVLRKEMLIKDTLLAQKATNDRVEENTAAMKEDDSDTAWTFATVMTIFTFVMLLVIICLCFYIKNLRNQRKNANDVRRHEKAAVESDAESPAKKKQAV